MWIFLGLISAISDASKNVLAKHNTKSFDSLVISWAWVTYSLIILIPIMFLRGIPSLDRIFWLAFTTRTALDVMAIILYVNALKRTDLSLSLPMLALTPLFLLFTGLAINQEFPKPLGLIGVGAIVLGTYLLNFRKNEKFYQPFLAIYQNKGAFMMFLVSIIWGITGSLHKLAILHSDPYFYTAFGALVLAVIFTPLAIWSNKQDFMKALRPESLPKIVPVGILDGLTVLTQMIGQSIALTVFIISLKRTSIIFSSILGWLFFKEPIKQRVIPICLMVAGVILISLS
ncbi:MAG: DMT family transporter [bacterium]|nr:DMT family transporter [bacterium]